MAVENITEDRSSLPWFQFYYQDFLVGTACLSLAERGAYITLICHQWTRGSIPDDATVRARLLGCAKRAADAAWAGIVDKFQQGADGSWRNARVELEREKQDRHRANGAKGGYAKTRSRPPSQRLAEAKPKASQPPSHSLAEAKPEPSQELANSYPSESESESDPERSKPRSALKSAPLHARATQTAGVMAGTLPRDHLNCHPPCIRVCISEKQHAILRERHGGTDGDMEAFYAEVRANLNGPVGQRPWEFWDSQFCARFGVTVDRRTAGNEAAKARFLARGAQ